MTEKKKDLNKKELLKYHKSFPISVFEEDLSIKKRILVQVKTSNLNHFPRYIHKFVKVQQGKWGF